MKKRLVGAVVLFAMAVVFLPMLIREPDYSARGVRFESVPDAPDATRDERDHILPLEQALEHADWRQPGDNPLSSQSSTASDFTDDPEQGEQSAPSLPEQRSTNLTEVQDDLQTWMVQVASFSEEAKAEALQQQLREAKLSAHIYTVDIKGRKWYRVRVGPLIERREAEEILARVAEGFQLKGAILRYP